MVLICQKFAIGSGARAREGGHYDDIISLMNNELAMTAKRIGAKLIDMSESVAEDMQTWADVLSQNSDNATAAMSAGFVSNPARPSDFEWVIDVQAFPQEKPVLRTWAIQTKRGDDGADYFYNIQLTFEVDSQKAAALIDKSATVTREDFRLLLDDQASHLARITVSNATAGDGATQVQGERYDLTLAELNESSDDTIANVTHALQKVASTFEQTLQNR